MTQTEHGGTGALTLFLAFVGGALVGGTAALLLAPRSGADTRRRITGAVGDTKELAARVPRAIRDASSAAQAAFAAALHEGIEEAGGDAAAPAPARAHAHHA